ncbi:MAG: DUF2141 domain-containing protein [Gammaproteobacteria bacterium]|nr:DUF2141 domain-containing protein [Gammaproteobacteria bacterium]MDH5727874.1 DUF2141 domain-containing protein [Gammaproteobacteria bacterium]
MMRLYALLFLLIFSRITFAATADLVIQVEGLKNAQGQVRAFLFDASSAFPKEELSIRQQQIAVADNKNIIRFNKLSPGKYAVSLFHDENNNGELDSKWYGPPSEGVGVSNNAKGGFGPPKYEQCEFEVKPGHNLISIKVKYL